jgi:hypothetical protein
LRVVDLRFYGFGEPCIIPFSSFGIEFFFVSGVTIPIAFGSIFFTREKKELFQLIQLSKPKWMIRATGNEK